MENFKKKFLEEAFEHIEDLEQALLKLDKSPDDMELIERVFRAMHSLKGGGAMFGFEKISQFTHDLENIYDLIRNGKISLSKKLLDVTLASVDHLKVLLQTDEEESDEIIKNQEKLLVDINELINGKKIESRSIDDAPVMIDGNQDGGNPLATYYILFQPKENIFDNGTNPLYLLDELAQLGKSKAIPHKNKLPDFDKLDTSKCYMYWEVLLVTGEDINAINDVFIFVEDECHIEINKLSDSDLLNNNEFIKNTEEIIATGKATIINDLQSIVKNGTEKKQTKKAKTEKNGVSKDHTISSIRVASDKLDLLMNLVSELVTTQARLSLFAEEDGRGELISIAENVQKLTRQLRDNAFSIVLIPVENMLTRFQRLIRDLSNELNKEVVFKAEGTETELDKTIIENLTDPLMHILRNSLDHGIESPSKREKLGKPAEGTILLKAFYSGANVHIQILDDGAGLDREKIKQKAVSKGLISHDANLSEKEIFDLLFMPGFSTAENVTDVSGRGVGMDVVRRKIADIRGEVEIDSELGKGTTITIKLPLTLSIIDGLLVKIAENFYVIPLSAVNKIYAVNHNDITDKQNNLVVLDGEQIPFFYLREEFNENQSEENIEQIVVIQYEDKMVGLAVDYVVGEYQAVLKPLGKHYKDQEIISGATILGDGTVALVMDTNKAVKHFANLNTIQEEK